MASMIACEFAFTSASWAPMLPVLSARKTKSLFGGSLVVWTDLATSVEAPAWSVTSTLFGVTPAPSAGATAARHARTMSISA